MARSKVWLRAHYRRLAILIACAVAIVSVPITVPPTQVAAAGTSPAIVALSPEAGPTTGGTTVTVYGDPNGANFVAGSTSVAFGLQAGTNVNVLSATELTVSSPPQAAGQVTVTVTVSGVTSSSAVSQSTTYEFVASGPFHALQARIFISSGQDILAGTTKDVQVTGQGGIPASGVSAVVFDLAAVPPPGDSGILEVLPTGLNKYTATNVAFQNGHYTTTLATVPLGVGGKIEIFNPNGFAMGAAIDVEGYVSSTQGDASGRLNSVPAARICDTRAGTPTTAGPLCGSGHQLTFTNPYNSATVQVTGNGGIPTSGVSAVILNLIAFNGPSGSSGNLLVYPTGGPQPPTVQLIWTGGVPANNHLIVPVSSTGSITIYNQPGAGSGTDIIVEVEGWITDNSNPAAAGALYNGNNGTRVCDTRTGSQVNSQCQGKTLGAGTNSETLSVMIAGQGGVAPLGPGLAGVEVAVTALNSTAAATNLILYPSNASPPNCSNPQTSDLFLYQAGMVMNTEVILPLGPDGKINITNCQGAVDVTVDVLGYYTPAKAVTPTLLGQQGFYTLDTQQLWDTASLGVNVASGDLTFEDRTLQLPGIAGHNLDLDLYYNSLSNGAGGGATFGSSWVMTAGGDINLTIVPSSSVTYQGPSGFQQAFTTNGSGGWNTPAGMDATLTGPNGSSDYTLTYHNNGQILTFNSSGQLIDDADRNGNTFAYAYNTNGTPHQITDAGGRTVTLSYNGTSNVSSFTESGLGRTYTFTIDGNHNLDDYYDAMSASSNPAVFTYDSAGRHEVVEIQDPAGKGYTAITYDDYRRVTDIQYANEAGGTYYRTYLYNSGAAGSSCNSSLSPTGNTVVNDADGNNTTYCWDSSGRVIQEINALGGSTYTTWNTDDKPLAIQHPDGSSTNYYYTDAYAPNEIATKVDEVPPSPAAPTAETTYTYNSLNEPLTMVSPDGNVPGCSCATSYTTSYSYDSYGNRLTTTDPLSHATTSTYNSEGETCWTYSGTSTNACASPPSGATTFTYDAYGDVMTSTNPVGDVTSETYDAGGRKLTEVAPDGNVTGCGCAGTYTTTYGYNALDSICWTYPGISSNGCSSPPSGATFYTYDSDGNRLTVTDRKGNVTTTAYDPQSRICWVHVSTSASPNGCASPPTGSTSYTYDGTGATLTSTDPDGNVTTNAYDALDQVCWSYQGASTNACSSPPAGATADTHDAGGNLLSTTDPSGNVTTTAYASDGKPCWTYTGSTTATMCSAPPTGATLTTYDAAGNVMTSTDGTGDVTTHAYNANNQECWTYVGTSSNGCSSPPSGATAYTYDTRGNSLTTTQANGSVVTNAYDVANELCWTYLGTSGNTCTSPPTGATSYTYDANGKTKTTTQSTGATVTNAYNGLGELCWTYAGASTNACTSPPAGATSYTYDNNGNKTSIAYPQGSVVVSEVFNANNEPCWTYVSTVVSTNACASAPTGSTTYTYDNAGNLKTAALPNGVTNSWNYDSGNAISSISDTKGGTTVFSATYTRNVSELVTQDSSQPTGYQYDQYTDQGRLCYAGSSISNACSSPPSGAEPYAYDAAGDITSNNGKTQAYNAQNELCWSFSGASSNTCASPPSGATTYTSDANRDRTSVVPAAGAATCYGYNTSEWLTSVSSGTGSTCSTPSTVATYTYDGGGLRFGKSVSGTTTNYSWDSVNAVPLLLQESAGSSTTSYVYGPTGAPLEEVLPSGSVYYYSSDNLGSTRVLTDSSGTVQDTDTYDPYGNVTSSTGSVQNHLLYDGQYLDSETGLYYLRARYYDPSTAQFLTVDPLVDQTMAPFAYTGGDPVNATDPSGEREWGWQGPLGRFTGYQYNYTETLGLYWQLPSRSNIAKYLESHLASIFPFSTGGCTHIVLNEHCTFEPATLIYDPLYVSAMWSTGFRLTVTGGSLGTGSTIQFNIDADGWWVNITEYAYAPHAYFPETYGVLALGLAKSAWIHMAHNLSSALGGGY